MVRRIHHIGYVVFDADKSIAFYRLLGLKFIHDVIRENIPAYDEMMGHKNVKLRLAEFEDPRTGLILGLTEFIHPRREKHDSKHTYVGFSHICYLVDDLAAEYT